MAEGIDVSHWQREVNWQAVKAAGNVFAWAKASGSRDTPNFVDPQYRRNRDEMRRLGIHDGAYHFWLGGKGVGGAGQAQHFYKCAGPVVTGSLLPALDIEDPPNGTLVITRGDLHALIWEAANLFQVLPIIYIGEELFRRFAWLAEELQGFSLWIAKWSPFPPTRAHEAWQWTKKKPVAGVGLVDGNRVYNLERILVSGCGG